MNKQARIFLAGVMLIAPFAVTAYVVWWIGAGVDRLVKPAIQWLVPDAEVPPGLGLVVALAAVYGVGLLTHLWAFRGVVRLLERLFSRVPVIRSIFESVRDILGLFGGDAGQMGQVVLYRPPGSEVEMLGIRTSTSPRAVAGNRAHHGSKGTPENPAAGGDGKVAVYLPMSYQIGGFTIYVRPEAVDPVDMSVEEALKIAATAEAGPAPGKPRNPKAE